MVPPRASLVDKIAANVDSRGINAGIKSLHYCACCLALYMKLIILNRHSTNEFLSLRIKFLFGVLMKVAPLIRVQRPVNWQIYSFKATGCRNPATWMMLCKFKRQKMVKNQRRQIIRYDIVLNIISTLGLDMHIVVMTGECKNGLKRSDGVWAYALLELNHYSSIKFNAAVFKIEETNSFGTFKCWIRCA